MMDENSEATVLVILEQNAGLMAQKLAELAIGGDLRAIQLSFTMLYGSPGKGGSLDPYGAGILRSIANDPPK